jgi:hypothetical protein
MSRSTIYSFDFKQSPITTLIKSGKILRIIGEKIDNFGNKSAYNFPCFDIRFWNGQAQNVGVQLNLDQLKWLVAGIKEEKQSSLLQTSKFGAPQRYLTYQIMPNDYLMLSSVDNEKVYGICLSKNDREKLLDKSSVLELLLQFHGSTRSQLSELINAVMVFTLDFHFPLEYEKLFSGKS